MFYAFHPGFVQLVEFRLFSLHREVLGEEGDETLEEGAAWRVCY